MKKNPAINTITVDAKGKSLGRLASEIATLLMGKDKPSFKKHITLQRKIEVENIAEFKLTGSKLKDKRYYRFTGYIGGLKTIKLEDIIKKDPGKALIKSVKKMLPKNRLQKPRLKNLIIKN